MAEDFSALENLLGIPAGSTKENIPFQLAEKIDAKTREISDKLTSLDVVADLPKTELIKNGLTLEDLEDDRREIIQEAKWVYSISKQLLEKLHEDLINKIVVTDRMYDAASKVIASVSANIKSLREINTQYRQEEEMRRLDSLSKQAELPTETQNRKLSPADITRLIEENRKSKGLGEIKMAVPDAQILPFSQNESKS